MDGSLKQEQQEQPEQAPLYALCRAWVRASADTASALPHEAPQHLSAPKPTLLPNYAPESPPRYQEYFHVTDENYNAQVVLTCLKQHWVTVRKHFAAVSRARTQQQQQQRLVPVLDRILPNIPVQQPNPLAGTLPGL